MKKLTYFFIRLWAPKTETATPGKPHYVARVEYEEGGVDWSVTREFDDANFFKKLKKAERVVQDVKRIVERIKRGWLFEIIRIEEEVVATNVPEKEKEPA